MTRPSSLAVLLIAACAATAAGAQTAPRGDMRITRVSDPVLACTLIATSEISRSGGGNVTLGRARTSREGEATVVSWGRVQIEGQRDRKPAACRAEPGAITSVTWAGVELLTHLSAGAFHFLADRQIVPSGSVRAFLQLGVRPDMKGVRTFARLLERHRFLFLV